MKPSLYAAVRSPAVETGHSRHTHAAVEAGAGDAELVQPVMALLDTDNLVRRVGAQRDRLLRFVTQASRFYRANPYHSWPHAVDVTQSTAWFVSRRRLSRQLPAADRFWLLIAAIGHDLDHPGHNNQWEVVTDSPLAQRYGKDAVLERHSLDILQELMARPDCNFGATMSEADQMRGAVLLPELLRATDFSQHGGFVAEFSAVVDACGGQVALTDPAIRLLLLKAILKAADISNTTLPFPEAVAWARLVMAEFWAQGQKERERGLVPGPLNDETKMSLEQAQVGFIEFAALSLYVPLARIEPDVLERVHTLQANLERYKAQMAQAQRSALVRH